MTLLSNQTNIDRILREFSYYTTKEEKEFVTGTIQAIGKCAMRIPEVLDRCMIRLLQLLTVKSSAVVAESVVVIKQLLQLPTTELSHNDDVVKQLTRLFSKVENPKAKAAIIWVVGEYLDKVGKYAPDILRQLAKEFITLDDSVKLQVLNLSAKLMVKNPEQAALISQYIFNLAKYDMSYDIRDRGRLLRHLLFNQHNLPVLSSKIKDLFITSKPSPVPPSYDMRFMLGSLAQTISQTTPCYNALPDWATEVQNAEERKVSEPEQAVFNKYIGMGSQTTELPSSYSTTLPTHGGTRTVDTATNLDDWLNGGTTVQTTENGEYPEGYDPTYEYPEGYDPTYEYPEGYDPTYEYPEGYDPNQNYEYPEGYDPNQNYEGYDQNYEGYDQNYEGYDQNYADYNQEYQEVYDNSQHLEPEGQEVNTNV